MTTKYVAPADFRTFRYFSSLQSGQRVEHQKFGFGVVRQTGSAAGYNAKATIQFEEVGEKVLLLSFAKLRVHD